MREDWSKLASENSRHFATPPLASREMTSEKQGQKFQDRNRLLILMMRHYPDLGSASDWLKKFSANHKHYQDLGTHLSSVWNFCSRFSDIISWGNQLWRRREMSAVFSGQGHGK